MSGESAASSSQPSPTPDAQMGAETNAAVRNAVAAVQDAAAAAQVRRDSSGAPVRTLRAEALHASATRLTVVRSNMFFTAQSLRRKSYEQKEQNLRVLAFQTY